MYKKVDYNTEIQNLKKYDVCAYSGENHKHMTVTVDTIKGERKNLHYYFRSPKEYYKFLNHVRRMIQ